MKDTKRAGVSLMAGEILESIQAVDGFCIRKFKADIVTEGIDYGRLKPGDVLKYGERKIRITRIGKPCFTDCPVPAEQKPCMLNKNVVFGEYVE